MNLFTTFSLPSLPHPPTLCPTLTSTINPVFFLFWIMFLRTTPILFQLLLCLIKLCRSSSCAKRNNKNSVFSLPTNSFQTDFKPCNDYYAELWLLLNVKHNNFLEKKIYQFKYFLRLHKCNYRLPYKNVHSNLQYSTKPPRNLWKLKFSPTKRLPTPMHPLPPKPTPTRFYTY